MSDFGCWMLLVLGLAFVAAGWDSFRRGIAAKRFNQTALDRIAAQEAETEKLHGQVQAVLGKLNAQTAATANRLSRVGGAPR